MICTVFKGNPMPNQEKENMCLMNKRQVYCMRWSYFLTGPIKLIWVQSLLRGCSINEGFSAAIVTVRNVIKQWSYSLITGLYPRGFTPLLCGKTSHATNLVNSRSIWEDVLISLSARVALPVLWLRLISLLHLCLRFIVDLQS